MSEKGDGVKLTGLTSYQRAIVEELLRGAVLWSPTYVYSNTSRLADGIGKRSQAWIDRTTRSKRITDDTVRALRAGKHLTPLRKKSSESLRDVCNVHPTLVRDFLATGEYSPTSATRDESGVKLAGEPRPAPESRTEGPPRDVPERIWWCHTCRAGLGHWGGEPGRSPLRCPSCHGADLHDVPFVPVRHQDQRGTCPGCNRTLTVRGGCPTVEEKRTDRCLRPEPR